MHHTHGLAQYQLEQYQRPDITLSFVQTDQVLPLVITPAQPHIELCQWTKDNKGYIDVLISVFGGLLFRDFANGQDDTFEVFIAKVSSSALTYTERSSPRNVVNGNIYTSTEHPHDKEIFLHSEQSYNLTFPMRIFFYCETAPVVGGTTPIADTRKIYQRIDAKIREKFLRKQYRYARYFWPLMGITWQTAFQTQDKSAVECYCRENQINFEWTGDDALMTYQVRPAVAKHRVSGELCWFNHATFFNVSTLDEETREMLACSFDEAELPNHTYYGDGSAIEPDVLDILRASYQQEKVEFRWQKGDILMLDNMMIAHGRGAFEGQRKILVGMSELGSWSDMAYQD